MDRGIDPKFQDLIRLRASQINGCAYCIDMHWKDLRLLARPFKGLPGGLGRSRMTLDRERAVLAGPKP